MWFRRFAAPRPVGPAPMTRTSTFLPTLLVNLLSERKGSPSGADSHLLTLVGATLEVFRLRLMVEMLDGCDEAWERFGPILISKSKNCNDGGETIKKGSHIRTPPFLIKRHPRF